MIISADRGNCLLKSIVKIRRLIEAIEEISAENRERARGFSSKKCFF
jgi:hypothetical protein